MIKIILIMILMLSGCYSKSFRLIERDMKTMQGQISALQDQSDSKFKELIKYRDQDVIRFNNSLDLLNYRTNRLNEFKEAHDKRWPDLRWPNLK